MIPPDEEIYEVEKRIADRRQRVESAFKATGRQAVRSLSSPWAIGAAALAGFVIAGGVRALRHRGGTHVDPGTKKAAKASTVSSIAMAAATWFIKSQFGSPVEMARFVLGKVKSRKEKAAPRSAPSAVPDRLRPGAAMLRPKRRQATTVS
jgi:hypothetical protein